MSREKLQAQDKVSQPQHKDRFETSLECASSFLLSLQYDKGYWLGELEADTPLESDYVFYLHEDCLHIRRTI